MGISDTTTNNYKPINSPSIDFDGNIDIQNNTCTITGSCYEKNPVMQVGSNKYGWTPDTNSSFPSGVNFINPFDTNDDDVKCSDMTNTSILYMKQFPINLLKIL